MTNATKTWFAGRRHSGEGVRLYARTGQPVIYRCEERDGGEWVDVGMPLQSIPPSAAEALEMHGPTAAAALRRWERSGAVRAEVGSDTGGATWWARVRWERTGRPTPRRAYEGCDHAHRSGAMSEAEERAGRCRRPIIRDYAPAVDPLLRSVEAILARA